MVMAALGDSVPRIEDERLLTGRGRYTDDIELPGQARATIVRSVHAAARIRTIDTAPAREAPGVIAVFTHADLAADGLGNLPYMAQFKQADRSPMVKPPHPALASDAVHHVGDGVALVIAETLAEAKNAAENGRHRLRAACQPVTDLATAAAPGAHRLFGQPAPTTSALTSSSATAPPSIACVCKTAAHVTSLDFADQSRLPSADGAKGRAIGVVRRWRGPLHTVLRRPKPSHHAAHHCVTDSRHH